MSSRQWLSRTVFLTVPDSSAKLMRLWEHHVNRLQPSLHQFWPTGDRKICAPQAIAVSSVRVKVQFRRHFGVLQRQEINRRILDMHRIVFSLNNEGRRSLLRDLNFWIRREILFRECQVSGINDHGEIWPAARPYRRYRPDRKGACRSAC